MEIFLQILIVALIYSIIANAILMSKYRREKKASEKISSEMISEIKELIEKNDRSILALRELLESTKPMKSNNWDSVREAFKGPQRIEVNERN